LSLEIVRNGAKVFFATRIPTKYCVDSATRVAESLFWEEALLLRFGLPKSLPVSTFNFYEASVQRNIELKN
jgi:hypothetical protein